MMKKYHSKKLIILPILALFLCFVGVFSTKAFSSGWTKEEVQFGNTLSSNLNGIYKYTINPNFVEEFNALDNSIKDFIFPQDTSSVDFGDRININEMVFGSNVLPNSLTDDDFSSFMSYIDMVNISTGDKTAVQLIITNSLISNDTTNIVESVDLFFSYINPIFHYDISSRTMSKTEYYGSLDNVYFEIPNNSNLYLFSPLISIFNLIGTENYETNIDNYISLLNTYTFANLFFVPYTEDSETQDIDIIWDANGGTFASENASFYQQLITDFSLPSSLTQVELSNLLDIALPTRENATFLGWSTSDATSVIPLAVDITSTNTTLYAIWEVEEVPTYTAQLNYNGNGGTLGENSTTTYTGYIDNLESSTLTLTQADVNNMFFNETEPDLRNGYIFKGWGLTPTDTEPFETVTLEYDGQSRLTGNFYAIWELNDEIPVNLKITISNNGVRTEIYNSLSYLQNINGNGGLSNLYFSKNSTFFRFNIGASIRKLSNILNYDYINYTTYIYNDITSIGSTDFITNILSTAVNDVIINYYNTPNNLNYEASDSTTWEEEGNYSLSVDNILPNAEVDIVIYINSIPQSEEENFLNWVRSVADIFSIFLAVNIGFITIGQFIFLVLAIFVIIFIIRMVRGGKGG